MFVADGFEPIVAVNPLERTRLLKHKGSSIRAVVTRGSVGLSAMDIAQLPSLEIICSLGAGYENIDLCAANERGIIVTFGPGLNTASVADHALALLLSIVRDIPQTDTSVKLGSWDRRVRPGISGRHLGILGLGAIGEAIAKRAANGFDMSVSYCSRRPKENCSYNFEPNVQTLASISDFLIVATPGGAETTHLVNEHVLDALGPQGYLVNIARGSVVDTRALISALKEYRIAGAALDVIEGEPIIPVEARDCPNLILTPHIAGRSPDAVEATVKQVINNLLAYFSGRKVLSPVPSTVSKS